MNSSEVVALTQPWVYLTHSLCKFLGAFANAVPLVEVTQSLFFSILPGNRNGTFLLEGSSLATHIFCLLVYF